MDNLHRGIHATSDEYFIFGDSGRSRKRYCIISIPGVSVLDINLTEFDKWEILANDNLPNSNHLAL